MTGTAEEFGQAVAAWLRDALRDAQGREKMTHTRAMKLSGVGRTTFYDILKATGRVEQESLQKLAAALNVPPPQIERVLRLDQPGSALTKPTLATLKQAHALLADGIDALERAEYPTPEADRPTKTAAAGLLKRHDVLAGHLGQKPASKRGKRAG